MNAPIPTPKLNTAGPAITVQTVRSPGGVEAWLVEEHSLPLIAVDFAFDGGASLDPDNAAGSAYLISGLLDEGAGDLDAEAFQGRMADHAISMGFEARRDDFHGYLQTLSTHRDTAFELLGLALNQPRFDADAVARVRAQVIAGLQRQAKNPEVMCRNALYAAAFPGHAYSRPEKGDIDSVSRLEAPALKALRPTLLDRAGLKIVVVGDITAAELAGRLDALFGELPKGEVRPRPEQPLPIQGLGQTHVIDLDVPQTVLRFVGPGLMWDDPDFITASVLNHILGGSAFTSRLFMEVREKRGLAYGVSSSLMPMRESAMLVGGTATRNDRAAQSMQVIREEMLKLAEEGPTEHEVEEAKRYIIGSYPLRFDTSPKIAGELLALALRGDTPDFLARRNGLFAAVTLSDVRRVAKRLFGNPELLVQAVGKPVALV
ncbi:MULTISPECIES: pitrilysin family protein [Bosea]|uniref:M16 family metallopeptidase n=1 Tax=Bosea TaxID=85413 RepID=UPI00214F65FC|nr:MULTISPECIES: pitrilysin family protein [Bosea]MCR4521257.1 insulinase family protein [Bosea sp. 47.2.35]MDR6826681.1 zinc protease [Bosea robiniae]MDR6893391.1 zinc protease [Bosea sp. BE109]MDR7136910.1 zinc protease [Bosea sp. BE168]MDR7173609.1 zinc protease [Bosea sp. BE271]